MSDPSDPRVAEPPATSPGSAADATARPGAEHIERAVVEVYAELRRLAEWHLRSCESGVTIQPTVLVHEAYVRLASSRGTRDGWSSQAHFFNAAALAMRRALIDWARSRKTRKRRRGDADFLAVLDLPVCSVFRREEIEALELALRELEADHPRWAAVATHRWFLGMTIEQTADLLDVSPRTVTSDWRFAQAWLRARVAELSGESQG